MLLQRLLTGIYTVFGVSVRSYIRILSSTALDNRFGEYYFDWIDALGGWGELVRMASERSDELALWRPLHVEGSGIPWWKNNDFPWLGIIIASPIIGIWYWCTDQYIVQRTLAAKNLLGTARSHLGSLSQSLAGSHLSIARDHWLGFTSKRNSSYSDEISGNTAMDIDGDQVSHDGDSTLACWVTRSSSRWLMAALMSSLSSLFNSCATLFTVDIYEKICPERSEKHLVRIGRLATTIIVALGLLWIPVMYRIAGGGIYQYLQSVQGYLAPPITAVFLLGLFWKRINATGAMWGLIVGLILGMAKLGIQAQYSSLDAEKMDDPSWLAAIGDFSFLYASGVLLLVSIAVVVIGSFLTPAQNQDTLKGLTYDSLDRAEIRATVEKVDVWLTVVTIFLVLGMYLFSFGSIANQNKKTKLKFRPLRKWTGEQIRTVITSLEGWGSTIELHLLLKQGVI